MVSVDHTTADWFGSMSCVACMSPRHGLANELEWKKARFNGL